MRRVLLALILLLPAPVLAQTPVTANSSGGGCATAGSCATFDVSTATAITFQVTGTFTGTLTAEGSSDATPTSYFPILVSNLASSAAAATTITTTGQYAVVNVGLTSVRLRATSAWTGTAVVTGTKGYGAGGIGGGSSGGGGAVTNAGTFATQDDIVKVSGTAISATNPVPIRAANSAGYIADDVAHDAVSSGNPVPIGGYASSTPCTAVSANGDRVYLCQGLNGQVYVQRTDGTRIETLDPCQANTKVSQTINQAAGAQLFTGTAAKKIYICSIQLITATAQNVALVAGTGSVCATTTVGIMGGATAATGWNFAANGGLTLGNGAAYIASTTVNADNLCIIQSSTGQISGNLTYVVQ